MVQPVHYIVPSHFTHWHLTRDSTCPIRACAFPMQSLSILHWTECLKEPTSKVPWINSQQNKIYISIPRDSPKAWESCALWGRWYGYPRRRPLVKVETFNLTHLPYIYDFNNFQHVFNDAVPFPKKCGILSSSESHPRIHFACLRLAAALPGGQNSHSWIAWRFTSCGGIRKHSGAWVSWG